MKTTIPNVINMTSSNGNKVVNQFIIETKDKIIFKSYNSIIAVKSKSTGKITLGRDWDYSRTTGKYRNQFLGEGIAVTREKIESGEYKVDLSL